MKIDTLRPSSLMSRKSIKKWMMGKLVDWVELAMRTRNWMLKMKMALQASLGNRITIKMIIRSLLRVLNFLSIRLDKTIMISWVARSRRILLLLLFWHHHM